MEEAKAARVRKLVVAICLAVPIICCGFLHFTPYLLLSRFDLGDDERYMRAMTAVETAYNADRVATRKDTLAKMREDPASASNLLSRLTFFEEQHLSKMPAQNIVLEANLALETQLEAMKILEDQSPKGIEQMFRGEGADYARRNVLNFAVLARRPSVLREHAEVWAESRQFGPMSDDWEKHDGYQFLGWADLIEGDVDGATRNLLRSGDFMNSPKLESVGPSTKLADALITKRRFPEIIAWLEKVGKHWEPETCNEWIRSLKKGKRPMDDTWTSLFDYS